MSLIGRHMGCSELQYYAIFLWVGLVRGCVRPQLENRVMKMHNKNH